MTETSPAVAVGRPYNPSVASWEERPHLRLTPRFSELALFYARVEEDEAAQITRGDAEFAWVDGGPVSVLCFRFGALNWADCTYEPHLAHPSERGVPLADGPGGMMGVAVVLVEATTGIVRGTRGLGWPPGFTRVVRRTVARQLEAAKPDDAAAAAQLAGMYRLPPGQLAVYAAARCMVPAKAAGQ